MARNIRWDESVKENVLNLVEALLSQADDELDDLELKAGVQVEWITQNKLRVTGKEKQKRGKREQVVEVGTRKEHLVKLVKKAGKSLKLPQRKKESGSSQPERELAEVQTALDCLRELGVLEEEKNTRKNQGYWKFTLTLKHQTATREENLEVVQQKWKEHPKTNSLVSSPTTPMQVTDNSIDWRNICLAMLEKQKRLSTNELMSADEDMKFELDEIHVPLALVQRTKPDKRSGDVSPEQGSRLYEPSYEEKQRFKHEDFLAQVLQGGKGQSKGRRIALIGEPGAGKTTLLQAIAFWLLEDKNKDLGLPIWVSLADLQGKTLEDYLLQRWLKNALEVVRVTSEQENALVELFKNNRVWLLLDGVDEIVAGSVGVGAQGFAPLQIIASHLEGWVAKARVVLSCRLNVWEANLNALGDDFEKYRLLDFDYPDQVKEFINGWFAKTDADKGERLWTELDKSERQRIQDLVKNPLRLALLCSTYNPDPPSPPYQGGSNESFSSHQGGSNESLSSHQGVTKDSLSSPPYQGGARGGNSGLPSTKAGLYQRFLKEFYKWKENRFPTTEYQQDELNAALGRLAKRAIDQEASRFRLRHKVVREELGDPKQQGSLFWLALQLGWLNQVGLAAESETQEKVYAFFHPTFQEYFAALAIDDWNFFLNHVPDNTAQGIYRIFEPQWKEVFLLWLGREGDKDFKKQKETFIEALIKFEDRCGDFYKYQAYFIAGAGIAEFEEFSYADEVVEQLIRWKFSTINVGKDNFHTPALIKKGATTALLETHYQKVIGALTMWLNSSQGEAHSLEIALTLLQIAPGNQVAISILTKFLSDSRDVQTHRKVTGFLSFTRIRVINNLEKFGVNNPLATVTLAKLSATQQWNKKTHSIDDLRSWFKLPTGNQNDLENFINLMAEIDMETLKKAIGRLNNINILVGLLGRKLTLKTDLEELKNFKSIIEVLDRLDNNQNEFVSGFIERINSFAVNRLVEITANSHTAVPTLVEMLHNTQDRNICQKLTWILGEAASRNIDATKAVIQLLQTTEEEIVALDAIHYLKTVLKSNLLTVVVESLKDYIEMTEVYNVIWHCAQNMTYPAFYQAWHQQEEAEKTTTPNSQSLNQSDLPQSLQSTIANDSQFLKG